ncbi:MAG TPA: alpha/beta hydrolase [Acidimicrobiales bacterium]|nr:alpha/beta hydrolase [Acidimicrobiales bacterium]
MIEYDEFSMFQENAEEFGIPYKQPLVSREAVDLGDGRRLSCLAWGAGPAELVFLHGGAQNAHTWDTVLLALDRPALAVDLPGHGHSDGGRAGSLEPFDMAADVAVAVERLAPEAVAVVGMSLGGLTSLALAGLRPELVRKLVLVDVTPGVNQEKSRAISEFVNGPATFPDFDALLARTVEHNPTRSVSSLRRGILHNAVQLEDGTWVWRWARHRGGPFDPKARLQSFGTLWDTMSGLNVPLMLVRGMRPGSVVDDADESEVLRRQPSARVEHVADAGHSVQGDAPLELAALIADFALGG